MCICSSPSLGDKTCTTHTCAQGHTEQPEEKSHGTTQGKCRVSRDAIALPKRSAFRCTSPSGTPRANLANAAQGTSFIGLNLIGLMSFLFSL